MKYLILLLVLAGCATKSKDCIIETLPQDYQITFCGPAVTCKDLHDSSGDMRICHIRKEDEYENR